MMYCSIENTSNDSFRQRLKQYDQLYNNYSDDQPYFTAQGDYGTTIDQLKQMNNNDNVSSEISVPTQKTKDVSHEYCVDVIMREMMSDDVNTLMSSYNVDAYKHFKKCNVCKKKINGMIKKHYVKSEDDNKMMGYDLKELVVIILSGLLLIIIIDLIVKLAKKFK